MTSLQNTFRAAMLAALAAMTLAGCGGGGGAAAGSTASTLSLNTTSNANAPGQSQTPDSATTTSIVSTSTTSAPSTSTTTSTSTPTPVPSSFTVENLVQVPHLVSGVKTWVTMDLPWSSWTNANVTTAASSGGTTYYISTTGNDSNSGTSAQSAFATVAHAVSLLQPGDTVLFEPGVYHQVINLAGGLSGTSAAPITFGNAGGGAVVLDASPVIAPSAWKPVNTSVYSVAVSKTLGGSSNLAVPNGTDPARAMTVIVNDKALRMAPSDSAANVTAGSGYFAYNGTTLTVDFGSAQPSSATVVVANANNPDPIYWYGANHLVFDGLTAEAGGNSGIWGYGSSVTVEHCVSQYNIKAGINFMMMSGNGNANNQALDNLVYMNSLHNWPRGTNGFYSSGGGWSGGLAFSEAYKGVARGNLVVDNGGEGIISYGSGPSETTGSVLFEDNLSMDNWSMQMYFDNQPNDIARGNLLYFSGYDKSTWQSASYDLYKYSTGLALADEANSSANMTANLAHSQVYNNLIVGCRLGITEYWEGNVLSGQHGLKNTLIANNTIVLMPTTPANTYTAGIYLWDNGSANTNSAVVNNLVIGWDSTEPVIWYQGTGADPGVQLDHNAYWNPGSAATFDLGFNTVSADTFAQWQKATGYDLAGFFADPMLANMGALSSPSRAPYDQANAVPQQGSPLAGAGMDLSSSSPVSGETFSANLAGLARGSSWTIGAF
ncbi:MAG: hypothetical protein KGJ85_16980 [Betaproteobacteria bacterium]|nr:hypothetical protein [Betaproteobacteria bacterium]